MTEIKFSVDGVDGEFAADLDELKSYKTVKQFARSETDPAGMMDAMERIFMGRDEEYIEALGGTSYDMRRYSALTKPRTIANSNAHQYGKGTHSIDCLMNLGNWSFTL